MAKKRSRARKSETSPECKSGSALEDAFVEKVRELAPKGSEGNAFATKTIELIGLLRSGLLSTGGTKLRDGEPKSKALSAVVGVLGAERTWLAFASLESREPPKRIDRRRFLEAARDRLGEAVELLDKAYGQDDFFRLEDMHPNLTGLRSALSDGKARLELAISESVKLPHFPKAVSEFVLAMKKLREKNVPTSVLARAVLESRRAFVVPPCPGFVGRYVRKGRQENHGTDAGVADVGKYFDVMLSRSSGRAKAPSIFE